MSWKANRNVAPIAATYYHKNMKDDKNPLDGMTPEEKAFYDQLMKKIKELTGKEVPSAKELWERQKQGVRTMEEWCCQDKEQIETLPKEIKDLKLTGRYSLCRGITGQARVTEAAIAIDMVIEAAFNFGKAQPK